jgi:hypothetical protein
MARFAAALPDFLKSFFGKTAPEGLVDHEAHFVAARRKSRWARASPSLATNRTHETYEDNSSSNASIHWVVVNYVAANLKERRSITAR